MKEPSYWEKETFLKPHDLIVVGAGIVGLSSALFYKQGNSEARVLVLDKGFIPEGAGTRNAGFACLGSITEQLADLEKESEQKVMDRITKRHRGLRLLRKTLGDEAIDYENCGGYELFTDNEKFKEAVSEIDRFNNRMSDLLGEDEVYRVDKFEGYPVIYNRLEGALHPGKMMQTLIKKVLAAGINIRWNCRVTKLDKTGVEIGNDVNLHTRQIVIATNGFTRYLIPELNIKPARGFIVVTEKWDNLPWKGIFHHDRGYIYFRNIGERLLIGGARNIAPDDEETDQFGSNKAIKNHLLNFAGEVLKLPPACKIEQEWSGIMGFTETKTPVIQRLNKETVVAAGLSGMGVAIGMEAGREAAALL